MASDPLRQLSLLRRRHKVKANVHCSDEAQNKAETHACTQFIMSVKIGIPQES